jgi:cytoskeletal protein RodZ
MSDDTTTGNAGPNPDAGVGEPLKPGKFGFKVRLNRQKREFRVCMTRAAAGVGFAGVCGILVGIVATARHVSKSGPQSAAAEVRDIRDVSENAPKPPSAAKVSAKQGASASASAKSTSSAAAKAAAAPTTKPSSPVAVTTTKAPLVTTAAPSTPPAAKAAPTKAVTVSTAAPKQSDKRTVGHQYLVLGSYPSLEEAKETVEKLKKDGVACTAEQSLPDWAKSGWYSVVTVKGYSTTHERGYERQVAKLEAKGYQPHAYKWRLAETD